ncbi:MAG: diguanylate cyclase [Alishewanella sp.]|nr:diguanylate cyclase [Alishewanella sp.]
MNEIQRLNKIAEYHLEKGFEDESLSELLAGMALLLGVPTALISVIGENEQFFKGRFGLDVQSTLRKDAFCNHVVENQSTLIVEDTKQNNVFVDNPLVTGEPHIRFYAGVPLLLDDVIVGAVCVIDSQPRTLDASQIEILQSLSSHVSAYLSLYRQFMLVQQEHSLIDNSPAVLLQWQNIHGMQLSYVSSNIETLFGIAVADLRKKTAIFEDFIDVSQLDEFNFLFSNHHSGVTKGEAIFRLKTSNNKQHWVKLITKAFFSSEGKLDMIHAMLIDHTLNRYTEQKLLETNQQMRLLLEASALGTWDWDVQLDVNKVNGRWCEIIGIDFDLVEPSSQYWRQLVHPADIQRVEQELSNHLGGVSQTFNTIYRMRHSSGHWVWIETYAKVVQRAKDGTPLRLAGTHRDITDKKKAELLEMRQRHLLGFISKAQSIYLKEHDLSSACRQILSELAEIAESQFAFIGEMRVIDGKSVLFIHAITEIAWNEHSNHLVQLYRQGKLYFESLDNLFGRVITSKKTVISNSPSSHPASRGTPKGHPKIFRFMGLPIELKDGVVGMIGLANKFEDYTQADATFLKPLLDALASLYYAVEIENARNAAEQQLKLLAMTDSLTGIPNRRAFVEHCAGLNKQTIPYVVAILDIDYFKRVNDTYGHNAGDQVIQVTATAIKNALRSDDYCARLGGEEFAILIENASIDTATPILETLRETIQDAPVDFENNRIAYTVSIGATAVAAKDPKELTEHLAHADGALYTAKKEGRNCIRWFVSEEQHS